MTRRAPLIGTLVVIVALALPGAARAQAVSGIVVDQTGLPLPGATVRLFDGETVERSLTTDGSGTFSLDTAWPGDMVEVSLDGFETARVSRRDAARVTLLIARATENTTVTASTMTPIAPSEAVLGRTLTADMVSRLPSDHMKARESLPLLPSVVRGPDGLMQIGGARATDTPLLLDGFNVTDPATGIASINLPFEAVKGIDALRDPMAVTYGGLLGGIVKMESKPGGDRFSAGVQGIIPRPRFSTPDFGRLEGIFPRGHVSGSGAQGRLRYMLAAEYDYERIPVPDSLEDDNNIVETSGILFGRVDAELTPKHQLLFETFAYNAGTDNSGLSPRRLSPATPDVSSDGLFVGISHRYLASSASLFTVQLGVLSHDAQLTPQGSGPSYLSPFGWRGNWFTTMDRRARRIAATATFQRIVSVANRSHDVTIVGEVASRKLSGSIQNQPVVVTDPDDHVVRTVDFDGAANFSANDRPLGLALRDVWQATPRTQIDAGVRVDHTRYTGGTPSARVGVRHVLDASGATVLKAGLGRFVGTLPLAVPAFGHFPSRVDRSFVRLTGAAAKELVLRPAVGRLRFPRATALTVALERQLGPRLDGQVAVTARRSSRVATVNVPDTSGDVRVDSSGTGRYAELQLSARRTWDRDQQLFVSYVRSSARAELNEFSAVFQTMNAPLLQPGGVAPQATNPPHRVLAWGTFNLPRRIVVSPVTEWRSGFRYSAMNMRYTYEGAPNARAYPAFLATDMVVYKTFTARKRDADVGIQLFNLTNHQNPRDVYPVVGAPLAGQFTNSVGTIVRGYFLLKW